MSFGENVEEIVRIQYLRACVRVYVYVYVRVCMRACVRAYVLACVRACVCVCVYSRRICPDATAMHTEQRLLLQEAKNEMRSHTGTYQWWTRPPSKTLVKYTTLDMPQ